MDGRARKRSRGQEGASVSSLDPVTPNSTASAYGSSHGTEDAMWVPKLSWWVIELCANEWNAINVAALGGSLLPIAPGRCDRHIRRQPKSARPILTAVLCVAQGELCEVEATAATAITIVAATTAAAAAAAVAAAAAAAATVQQLLVVGVRWQKQSPVAPSIACLKTAIPILERARPSLASSLILC
jgi:hypothetical protein